MSDGKSPPKLPALPAPPDRPSADSEPDRPPGPIDAPESPADSGEIPLTAAAGEARKLADPDWKMPTFPTDSPDEPEGEDDGTPASRTMMFKRAIQGRKSSSGGLGTFAGVFRPTILTILGVMMYLRLGWVVGEAGLLGAIGVIVMTFVITSTTALSLSSITTNIRLGAGGVFSIISKSLGLETGGAIGIPLYLAQALSAALYIYGFSEAWMYIFPSHPQWVAALGVFVVAVGTTTISTKLAFRLQGFVMFIILASVGSIFLGLLSVGSHEPTLHNPQLIGTFSSGGFWEIFAIFFPAGTGIMVGASMSGALESPRRSVPRGTMMAVATAFAVYVSFAAWYAIVAPPAELASNFLVVVDKAAYGPLVLAGILASTFTATLSSLVAAPRVLQALGQHRILPRSTFFSKTSKRGEPRNASLVTAAIVALALTLGSLDRVAVLITMFFLLTYVTINVVVLIEQSLGMVSFRPMFKVPILVPTIGSVLCVLAIFIISPTFALLALCFVVGIYVWLVNKRLDTPWETVRSSIFVALADWAARRVAAGPDEHNERSWKPDILVPIQTRAQIDGNYRFLRALAYPKGSVQVVGIVSESPNRPAPADVSGEVSVDGERFGTVPGVPTRELAAVFGGEPGAMELEQVAQGFQEDGLYASAVTLEANDIVSGVEQACAVLRGSYFRPNVIFGLAHLYDEESLQGLVNAGIAYDMGVALLFRHQESGLGRERIINVWVRDQSPEWYLGLRLANLDLSILSAYQIWRNWTGTIRLVTAVRDPSEIRNAQDYLDQLTEDARLPKSTETSVLCGNFLELVESTPPCDLHIMGLANEVNREFLEGLVDKSGSSILFVRDSGRESALA